MSGPVPLLTCLLALAPTASGPRALGTRAQRQENAPPLEMTITVNGTPVGSPRSSAQRPLGSGSVRTVGLRLLGMGATLWM